MKSRQIISRRVLRKVAWRRNRGPMGQGHARYSDGRIVVFDRCGRRLDTTMRPRGAGSARSSAIGDALARERAQGKPGAHDTRSRAHKMHTADRRCAGTPGFPRAVVLRLMPRSPRSRIPLASVADGLAIDRSPVGPDNLHRLDTSNGCQDHAVLPSAASSSHTLQPARMLPEEVSTEAFKRRSSARCARSRKDPPREHLTRPTLPRPPHPPQRS